MEKLRAFVGHSFDEKDQEVVNHFQRFFDSLKDTIGFEWDHAERPEAKAVSEKVKEKMEGKDVFIGIFTRKDYRVSPDKFKKLPIVRIPEQIATPFRLNPPPCSDLNRHPIPEQIATPCNGV
jgi:hypothetical protein